MAPRQASLVSSRFVRESGKKHVSHLFSSNSRHFPGSEETRDPLSRSLFDAFRSFLKVVPLGSAADEQRRIQFGDFVR